MRIRNLAVCEVHVAGYRSLRAIHFPVGALTVFIGAKGAGKTKFFPCVAAASQRTQVWLVTHSERLAVTLRENGRVQPKTVIKRNGETWIEGLQLTGNFGPAEPD